MLQNMRFDSALRAIKSGFRGKRRSVYPIQKNPIIRSFSTTPSKINSETARFLDEEGFTAFKTLHELQVASCKVYSENDLFGTYSSISGKFEYLSYGDFGKLVSQCRVLLKDLGESQSGNNSIIQCFLWSSLISDFLPVVFSLSLSLNEGIKEYDKVGIISNNRWEWAVIAAATYSLNATFVPMYESQLVGDWRYILNDSGSSIVFCATQDIYDKVNKEVLPSTPGVYASLCLDANEGEHHSFNTAIQNSHHSDDDEYFLNPPNGDDLANLIYTSGTTGQPKGVELTHSNVTFNIMAAGRQMVKNPRDLVDESDRSLAFLPWAHSYGQTCELWMGMSMGASMGICRGVHLILEDLQLVKPSILFAVPTLYKKVYAGVHNLMESKSTQSKLLRNAIDLGHAHADFREGRGVKLGPLEKIKFALLDKLVLSKVRDRFGGNLRYGCVAGAACPPEVLSFMDSIGIPICEGYGLTETSPIITLNTPEQRSIGSVGRPIPGVSVYVVDEEGKPLPPGEEGEICCVGPNVMKGYYNKPEVTDEVISVAPDGKSRM